MSAETIESIDQSQPTGSMLDAGDKLRLFNDCLPEGIIHFTLGQLAIIDHCLFFPERVNVGKMLELVGEIDYEPIPETDETTLPKSVIALDRFKAKRNSPHNR